MLIIYTTTELPQLSQVIDESAAPLRCNAVCIFAGAPRLEQGQELMGPQPKILLVTPRRLIDFMKSNHVDLTKVSYLVLDEAERQLDMTIETQIRTGCH